MHGLTHKTFLQPASLVLARLTSLHRNPFWLFPSINLELKKLRAPGGPAIHPNTFPEGTCFQLGFPGGVNGKEPACQRRRCKFDPWVRKIPWRRSWLPTPVFLPRESHGRRSLVGYSPWGHTVGHDWSDLARRCLRGGNIHGRHDSPQR